MPIQFPPNPIKRLVDTRIPDINVADVLNPTLLRMPQIPGFGWGANCTPQMAAVKLRESFAHIPAPHLVQNIAHAKRWIKEKITTYVDGALIYFMRHVKFAIDVLKIIQYAVRIVATLNYVISLLNKELALAAAWASECTALVAFAKSELTTGALATESERILAQTLDTATAAISKQVAENSAHLACFF